MNMISILKQHRIKLLIGILGLIGMLNSIASAAMQITNNSTTDLVISSIVGQGASGNCYTSPSPTTTTNTIPKNSSVYCEGGYGATASFTVNLQTSASSKPYPNYSIGGITLNLISNPSCEYLNGNPQLALFNTTFEYTGEGCKGHEGADTTKGEVVVTITD